MKVSRKGVRFVAAFEGFRKCPYKDVVGVWTIGYGTTHGVHKTTPCISKRKARKFLRYDLTHIYLKAVPRAGRMEQCELDALASFAYNLGTGAVSNPAISTLARRLKSNEGKTYERRKRIYREEIPKWNKAGGHTWAGLVRRRKAEVRLACKGKYS